MFSTLSSSKEITFRDVPPFGMLDEKGVVASDGQITLDYEYINLVQ
jgi:hypothetical protein